MMAITTKSRNESISKRNLPFIQTAFSIIKAERIWEKKEHRRFLSCRWLTTRNRRINSAMRSNSIPSYTSILYFIIFFFLPFFFYPTYKFILSFIFTSWWVPNKEKKGKKEKKKVVLTLSKETSEDKTRKPTYVRLAYPTERSDTHSHVISRTGALERPGIFMRNARFSIPSLMDDLVFCGTTEMRG